MIPHNCPQAVRRLHLSQQACARLGRGCSFSIALLASAQNRHRNEVAGQDDEVGMKIVYYADRGMKRMFGKVRIVVEVAEQRHGEAVEAGGPTPQGDFLANDLGTIRLNQNRVRSDRSDRSRSSESNEIAPGSRKKSQSILEPLP